MAVLPNTVVSTADHRVWWRKVGWSKVPLATSAAISGVASAASQVIFEAVEIVVALVPSTNMQFASQVSEPLTKEDGPKALMEYAIEMATVIPS